MFPWSGWICVRWESRQSAHRGVPRGWLRGLAKVGRSARLPDHPAPWPVRSARHRTGRNRQTGCSRTGVKMRPPPGQPRLRQPQPVPPEPARGRAGSGAAAGRDGVQYRDVFRPCQPSAPGAGHPAATPQDEWLFIEVTESKRQTRTGRRQDLRTAPAAAALEREIDPDADRTRPLRDVLQREIEVERIADTEAAGFVV